MAVLVLLGFHFSIFGSFVVQGIWSRLSYGCGCLQSFGIGGSDAEGVQIDMVGKCVRLAYFSLLIVEEICVIVL